ncbi:MAG: SlyX family protein [Treponema sp.]|nr:SlyX family protein [Treponema sp.]
MMDDSIEEKLVNLEVKFSYMEDFISKLQEVCVENQKEIEILRRENQILAGRIQDLSENMEIPNRRPPHY